MRSVDELSPHGYLMSEKFVLEGHVVVLRPCLGSFSARRAKPGRNSDYGRLESRV